VKKYFFFSAYVTLAMSQTRKRLLLGRKLRQLIILSLLQKIDYRVASCHMASVPCTNLFIIYYTSQLQGWESYF